MIAAAVQRDVDRIPEGSHCARVLPGPGSGAAHYATSFPEFPAALSFLFGISPEEALAALRRRAESLRASLASLDRELHDEGGPPRLFLIETEYVRVMTAAELGWVEGVVEDLEARGLEWSWEALGEIAQRFPPPD